MGVNRELSLKIRKTPLFRDIHWVTVSQYGLYQDFILAGLLTKITEISFG